VNSFSHITEHIIAFRDARNWEEYHSPENLAKSIIIEAAELLECYQWNDVHDPDNIEDEAADVAIYLLLFCHETGIDLERAIWDKTKKNGEKYPTNGDDNAGA